MGGGRAGRNTRVLGTQVQYPLCLIDPGLTAGCSWPCMCGGRKGLLVASDWLRPVTRGRAGVRLRQSQRHYSLTSAD